MIDPFSVLGLEASASPDEVTAAYRRLARTKHPDAGGDTAEFATLSLAYREALRLAEKLVCPDCSGRGSIIKMGSGFVTMKQRCPTCGGSGLRWA